MTPNFIFCVGFVCLAYIILLDGVDANPLIKLTSKQIIARDAPNYGETIITAKDNVSDNLLVAENNQYIEMFGKRKKYKADEEGGRVGAAGVAESDAEGDGVLGGVTGWRGVARSGARGGDDDDKECTISLPRFKTDAMGNWVYNPWGITFGKVWEDTRFNVNGRVTIPRIKLDREPVTDYYPDPSNLNTVCLGRSTIYNKVKVKNYLSTVYRDGFRKSRPILRELRRNLYKNGNPEECHGSNIIQHRPFQECMIRRNQRMESLIPKYPRHQLV